eukprot:GHVU01220429.1.p1 GENE.GHVU01220429.1~~GHVU01220429.1.p1  ORF type:complete len:410 (+),score=45.54 GHVU01220429.1:1282-2511(+)
MSRGGSGAIGGRPPARSLPATVGERPHARFGGLAVGQPPHRSSGVALGTSPQSTPSSSSAAVTSIRVGSARGGRGTQGAAAGSRRAGGGRQAATGVTPAAARGRGSRRRKLVYNTTVRITTKLHRSVDQGPQQPARLTVGGRLSDGFQQLLFASTHDIPVWNGTVNVKLTGALEGEYEIDGVAMLARMETVLGDPFTSAYNQMPTHEKDAFLREIIAGLCKSLSRLHRIMEELYLPAPPALPFQFRQMDVVHLLKTVDEHQDRLRLGLGDNYEVFRQKVQDEHACLQDERIPVQGVSSEPMSFDEHWRGVRDRVPILYALAACLATVYPGNADVERDFAVLKWLFAAQRESLGVAALVGSIICKQLPRVRALVEAWKKGQGKHLKQAVRDAAAAEERSYDETLLASAHM